MLSQRNALLKDISRRPDLADTLEIWDRQLVSYGSALIRKRLDYMEMLAEKQAVFDAFADKSTVAEETLELDEKSFGDIMESEIKRIQESRAANQNEENK